LQASDGFSISCRQKQNERKNQSIGAEAGLILLIDLSDLSFVGAEHTFFSRTTPF
jgi:hypothetical protein